MILKKKNKLKGKLLYASKHQDGGTIRVSSYDDPAFKAESDSTASANISIKMLADMKKSLAEYKKVRKQRLKLNDDSLPEAVDLYGKEVDAIKDVFKSADASNSNLKKYSNLGIKPVSSESVKVNDRTTETMSIFKKPTHKVVYVKKEEVKPLPKKEKKPLPKKDEGTHTMPDGTVMSGTTHNNNSTEVPKEKKDPNDPMTIYNAVWGNKSKPVSVVKKKEVKKEVKKDDNGKGYIKNVVGGFGPTNLFYVDSAGKSRGITDAEKKTKYSGLLVKDVKYKKR